MKAHLINEHLLVPRSMSSAKVKVRYQGHVSQKMGVSGALVFHKHILFLICVSHGLKDSEFFGKIYNFIMLLCTYTVLMLYESLFTKQPRFCRIEIAK